MKTKNEFRIIATKAVAISKKSLLLLGFFISFITSMGQTEFKWAKRSGGAFVDYWRAVAVDVAGNSFVTGSVNVASNGQNNDFVAKYNSSGAQQWIKPSVGFEGRDIFVDGSGFCYVTGTVNASIPGTIFLTKLNTLGEIQWTNYLGSNFEDVSGTGVSVDASGNVFVVAENGLIAKYNASGVLQWTQKFNSTMADIDIDALGNIYVTGSFLTNITFGSFNLNAASGDNIFIAKANSSGTWLWAIKANEQGIPRGLDVDGANNVIITGENGTALISHIFVVKYNTSGVFQWLQTAQATNQFIAGYDVATDNFNNIYITGSFGNGAGQTLLIGNPSVLNHDEYLATLTSKGGSDIYFAKYGPDGTFKWAQSEGSTSADFGYGITVDMQENIYLAGSFMSSITFGGTTLTSAGQDDGFLVKLIESRINGKKVDICHKGKIINVSENAAAAHLAHGDQLGSCYSSKSLLSNTLTNDEDKPLILSPNPTAGLFSLEVCKNDVTEEAKIKVLNSVGQIVYNKSTFKVKGCIEETIELNNDLPEGIYFLNLTIGEKVEIKKIILIK